MCHDSVHANRHYEGSSKLCICARLEMIKISLQNDLSQLEGLILKWQSVSQEATQALLELSPTTRPRPSMGDLLNYLSISSDIIQYDHEDESFY